MIGLMVYGRKLFHLNAILSIDEDGWSVGEGTALSLALWNDMEILLSNYYFEFGCWKHYILAGQMF